MKYAESPNEIGSLVLDHIGIIVPCQRQFVFLGFKYRTLLLTVITGIAFPIAKALHQRQLAGFLLHLHTLETVGLDTFFPIINGLGLLGLLVTGVYMTNLFQERRTTTSSSNPLDL